MQARVTHVQVQLDKIDEATSIYLSPPEDPALQGWG